MTEQEKNKLYELYFKQFYSILEIVKYFKDKYTDLEIKTVIKKFLESIDNCKK